jgi:hypothetical protein
MTPNNPFHLFLVFSRNIPRHCRDPTSQRDSLLNVKWDRATKTDHVYLSIDTQLSMKRDLFKERMQFWEDVLGRRAHQ